MVCIAFSVLKMSFKSKKSKSEVELGRKKWARNLTTTTKRRPSIPEIKKDINVTMCKMPLNRDIVGRFLGMYDELKGKADRIKKISQEVQKLWEKLNFPFLSKQQISARVEKLIIGLEKYRKRQNEEFEKNLTHLFDITNQSGNWLSCEDKELYKIQIESEGRVGYTTEKVASPSTIHPSKRPRSSSEPSTSQVPGFSCSSSSTEEDKSSADWDVAEELSHKKKKYQATTSAAKLVSKASLSTRKASNVLQNLAEEGIDVPTPSQSGIWRRVIKDAEKIKNRLKVVITKEEFCLHFDGKRIGNKEYQVVCLKNSSRVIHLGALACESGSAEDIFIPMQALLDEYNAWRSIKMIISDTTAVNTGRRSGVIVRLQNKFRQKGLVEPQFIGCQHHILDLVLRHVMDFLFPTKLQSPSINYQFIEDVISGYDELKKSYCGIEMMPKRENPGWRDDFKFLFELCEAYNFYQNEKKWPQLKWQKLPSLHSARWNSRAIFALIAFFLLSKWRDQLQSTCNFIATVWSTAWFSNQHYSEDTYNEIHAAVSKLKCPKALKCFSTHWIKERSVLDVPRSNMVAERAVKLMEELQGTCKTDKYLNSKFINSNSQI